MSKRASKTRKIRKSTSLKKSLNSRRISRQNSRQNTMKNAKKTTKTKTTVYTKVGNKLVPRSFIRQKPRTANVKIKAITECIDSKKGLRDYQEDRYMSIADPNNPISIFAVFDGHGGNEISIELVKRFREELPPLLTDRSLLSDASKFKMEMKRLCKKIDEDMKQVKGKAGSTAIIADVDVEKNVLYLINLGDSRAVVIQDDSVIVATKDMKPEDPKEIQRIKNLGGMIKDNRVMGILALTRAFGDYDIKPYVSNVPKVYGPIKINKQTVVVLATDGLWDTVSNKDVENVVKQHKHHKKGYKGICEYLTKMSLKRGSEDNVTVMTAVIG